MEKFRYKLIRFMSGRYGADQLYYAMTVLCILLMILNSFLRIPLLNILVWSLLILMVIRSFSRNIYKRQLENQKFLRIYNPVKAKVMLTVRKIREIRTNRYRTCPHCKASLRLPKKKGKHTVECPRCHKAFQVSVRF
ncbi:MAG TPA: hypothetical protein DD738_06380 [Ruminiclostridium sp.]|nr:hypothetical protein [Ruminiclostridium sp.]